MTAGRGGRAGRGRQMVLVGTAVVVLVLVGVAGVNLLRTDPVARRRHCRSAHPA